MSSDIEIKASEAFLTTIDVTSAEASRALSVTSAMWYAQVFLADTYTVPRIFFMADIDSTVDWDDNLRVEVWSLTTSGSGISQIFSLDSLIQTFTGPYESLATDSSENNPITDALWYYIDADLTVTQNDYYAMVFKSNDNSPKIYFSNEYRQSMFVQIMASDDSGTTWSNTIVPTQSSGRMRTGAICCGYVGDELTATNSFDSGDVTIGGTVSASRGHVVYIYVENMTSQANRRNNISIDFNMIPPTDTSTYGTSKETDQCMMRWYCYKSGTLPLSSDSYLYKTLDSSPVLDNTADFVMFMQPDRLSPHGVAFFPETEIDLQVEEIGMVPIYEGTTSLGSDESIIFDDTNRMSSEYWAQFTSQANESKSPKTNPSYIDLSLEKRNKDVEVFGKISLNAADAARIRGFSHIVLYRDSYIAFPKFLADTDDAAWPASYPNGDTGREYIVYVAASTDTSTWTRTVMPITDSPSTSVRGNDNIIIGIHDVMVKKTGSSASTETIFIIFQTYAEGAPGSPLNAFFDVAYTTASISGNSLTVQALDIEEEDSYDGEFAIGSSTTDIDYQSVKFIEPNIGSSLYIAARNRDGVGVSSSVITKFGLWSINLTATMASSTSVAKINTSDVYYGLSNNLNYRGFDPNITHENEISYILFDGDDVYFGMDTTDNVFTNDPATSKNASIYKTSDFVSFDQVVDGDKGQSWSVSGVTNQRVVFMIIVDRILHIWMSSLSWDTDGKPYHIAHDTNTYTTKLLRRFPIEDSGDSEYGTIPQVSHLNYYTRSKYIRQIIGGAVNSHYIYIYGLDGYQDQYTIGVRWVMYDDRMINQAFEYYNDSSYHSWQVSTGADVSYEGIVRKTYVIKKISGTGVGVYHGKTMGRYPYDATAFVWDDYPAIPVYSNNISSITCDRIGSYCGIVASASSELASLDNDNGHVNPRVVVQSGIAYLICDHYTRGCMIYKTYGIKQLPEYWGNKSTLLPDLDLDKSCYLQCNSSYSSLRRYLRTCAVDDEEGINYVMELKENNYEPATYGYNTNFVDSNEPERYILRITSGVNKLQSLSWYYKFMKTANFVVGDTSDFLTPGSSTSQSETNIKLKTANTLEDLFFDPSANTLWLADDVSETASDHKVFLRHVFPSDIESNFIRLETNSIKDTGTPNYYPQVNVFVKGLKAHDLDMGGATGADAVKKVAINGIVHGAKIPEVGYSIKTSPSGAVAHPSSRGVYLSPGGEIIVDFPKPIFINEISFKAYYDGSGASSEDYSEFYFYFLPVFEKQTYGEGLISDSDWVAITDPVSFDPSENASAISIDSLSMYTQTLKIVVKSGLTIRVNDLTVKSLGGKADQFQSSGDITNPELIVVDDLEAIIVGREGGTRSAAYATMSKQDDYVIVDIGNIAGYNGVPITRITANVSGVDNSTRTLSIDTWDGSAYDGLNYRWENVKTFPVQNYEYSFVSWDPEEKDKSKKVKITTLTGGNIPANISSILSDANNYSNFSSLFASSALQKYSFKPNIYKDRSLTVLSSGSQDGYSGYVKVNCQMDADGPFAGDIGSVGLLEKNINLDFPLKQIRLIRIKLLNSGEDVLRINGLKTYTPLLDSTGNAIWPKATVVWTIKLNAYVSG